MNKNSYISALMLAALFGGGCLTPAVSFAQTTIQSVSMEAGMVGPRTLLQANLLNPGSNTKVNLEGELLGREGQIVLSFRTESFRLAPGMHVVTSAMLAYRSFTYGNDKAGRAAQRFHRLPGGDYQYCVRLNGPHAESSDEYCDELHVEEMLFLDLVHPWDGDSIDDIRPALTWMLTGAMPSLEDADVRIVLAPMNGMPTAAQALSKERPLFMVPHVKHRTLPFPGGVQSLERGKCYAWQAELLDRGRVTERSEPWMFCVRKQTEPFQNKYVRLDRLQPGATYEALDRKIFFRYDESYSSNKVDCSIYGQGHLRINPEMIDDAKKTEVLGARSVGVNLYELDLQPYNLKPGYYSLVVRNEKGKGHTLNFHVAP